MEVSVRSARLTDLDASLRILARDLGDIDDAPDVSDFLRNLLFVPSATVLIAEAERQVVGIGVLTMRPSVRSGPFVGVIDELGVAAANGMTKTDRQKVAGAIVEHLTASARNKGCTRVEVTEPLVSAESALWKRIGFASRGRTLGRPAR